MPPRNAGYMYAAYLVAAAVYGFYALGLWRRTRRVRDRLRQLEQTDSQ